MGRGKAKKAQKTFLGLIRFELSAFMILCSSYGFF